MSVEARELPLDSVGPAIADQNTGIKQSDQQLVKRGSNLRAAALHRRWANATRQVFINEALNDLVVKVWNPNAAATRPMREVRHAVHVHTHGAGSVASVDQSTHSLFGASKLAADVLVQEYGRYFGMPTCCLRAGCITGPNHSGVELHGFLSYLVKCNVEEREYRVFGYKGKQVRDNIHARDVAAFIHAFWQQPRVGEVYNIGGGKANSCSVLEAFEIVQSITGRAQNWVYDEAPRRGDHICYFTDLRKAKSHYPEWSISTSLRDTVREIVSTWNERRCV